MKSASGTTPTHHPPCWTRAPAPGRHEPLHHSASSTPGHSPSDPKRFALENRALPEFLAEIPTKADTPSRVTRTKSGPFASLLRRVASLLAALPYAHPIQRLVGLSGVFGA